MNLKCVNLREDIYNQILNDLSTKIIEIDKLTPDIQSLYQYRKKIIYIKETKEIICSGMVINYYCNTNLIGWKQVICTLNNNIDKVVEDRIDGPTAWHSLLKILRKKYSRNMIETILTSYDSETSHDRQYHYNYPNVSQNVIKLPFCVKYDINGAHTDALKEMFPESAADFDSIYKKRHDNIYYKNLPNYFVGMLKHYGYNGAYWHIVDRTTKTLLNAIDTVGGQLVYANTDGFCVQYPKRMLPTTTLLGGFKEEYKGTVYFYSNNKQTPYVLYQFGNEFKGTCMNAVRQDIDLSKGKVVYYNRVKHGKAYLPENIVKETIEING